MGHSNIAWEIGRFSFGTGWVQQITLPPRGEPGSQQKGGGQDAHRQRPADHPGTIRQAGQANVDIMLVPSHDWREIDPLHTQMAPFRAIENGFSLVRQTGNGLAMTVDDEGNVLSASDYFTSDPQVMVAYVPTQGVHTIYATIGDLFAWLSIAGLVGLIGFALARRRKVVETEVAEPGGEPLPVS
jgi:apolipoprotein N-acyltransferase